jgi:hypothetical protein
MTAAPRVFRWPSARGLSKVARQARSDPVTFSFRVGARIAELYMGPSSSESTTSGDGN